jgi:hypothetical protein
MHSACTYAENAYYRVTCHGSRAASTGVEFDRRYLTRPFGSRMLLIFEYVGVSYSCWCVAL